jgi:hypothetical protein
VLLRFYDTKKALTSLGGLLYKDVKDTITMTDDYLKLYRGPIKRRDQEIALLRIAVTRYCDKSRMGTIEPMDDQQAVDRAFTDEPI